MQGNIVRISNYLKSEIEKASKIAFGECELILFGSRGDDNKRGGDFDIAVVKEMSNERFREGKVQFFKYLLLKDLDLPIDLVLYKSANSLLKKEIEKGITL